MSVSKRINPIAKLTFVSLVTIGVFYVIFTKIDFYSVVTILSRANPFYLLLSLLPLILSILIGVKRWQIILKTMGYPVPFIKCFNVLMAAVPLTSITPSKSGDIIRAYYLKNEIPPTRTAGSVLTERIFDVLTLISFSLIGMVFYQKYEFASIIFSILLVLIVLVFIPHLNIRLPVKRSWNEKLQNIAFSMKALTSNKKAFAVVILLSTSIWLLSVVQTVIFFYVVGVRAPLLFTMANIPIAIFIGMIPVTLGGMGTRDASIIFLFSEVATPSELLSVGILFSLFRYWLISLAGIPFMRMMMKRVTSEQG